MERPMDDDEVRTVFLSPTENASHFEEQAALRDDQEPAQSDPKIQPITHQKKEEGRR